MATLFVDRKDCCLEWDGSALALRAPDAPVRFVPLALVDRVVLRADTRLSSRVLTALAAHDVGLLALGGRGGREVACVLGAPHADVLRRIAQVRCLDDGAFQLAWCRSTLRAKLGSGQRLLARAQVARPDLRRALGDALGTLHDCRARLAETTRIDQLRGLEGAGAAAYFRGYATLFAPALGFTARRRRPPRDPVNACLSLGYTLLQNLATVACRSHGLDPMIGYLHRPARGRASLACDLVEPWRAAVDELVWQLFRDRVLDAGHFGREANGACLLNKAGRARFFAAWAGAAARLSRALRRHAMLAARSLGDLSAEFDTGDAGREPNDVPRHQA